MDNAAVDSFEGIRDEFTAIREHLTSIKASLTEVSTTQNEHTGMIREILSRLTVNSDR
ncbi:hypothetical protein [Nocardia acidivorans]|uniref:hypothetical protein n=1 Tax=Nocardia acidivorans TaxID=404580 RepID=UPI0012FC5E6D|nr:hypothetical protein [Nocardia acidivorans]